MCMCRSYSIVILFNDILLALIITTMILTFKVSDEVGNFLMLAAGAFMVAFPLALDVEA